MGYRSLKVIESGTILKLGYVFLFAFYSNYGRIFSHSEIFSIKELPDLDIIKVIENGVVR